MPLRPAQQLLPKQSRLSSKMNKLAKGGAASGGGHPHKTAAKRPQPGKLAGSPRAANYEAGQLSKAECGEVGISTYMDAAREAAADPDCLGFFLHSGFPSASGSRYRLLFTPGAPALPAQNKQSAGRRWAPRVPSRDVLEVYVKSKVSQRRGSNPSAALSTAAAKKAAAVRTTNGRQKPGGRDSAKANKAEAWRRLDQVWPRLPPGLPAPGIGGAPPKSAVKRMLDDEWW